MAIITEDIKTFVNRTKPGFVATVCPDGSSNLSPKGTTMAWDESHLVFGRKCWSPAYDTGRTEADIREQWTDHWAGSGTRH